MLGEITAQTMKMQTYTDAIETLLSTNITLPPELLKETQTFVETNKKLGYTTREEFIRDALRNKLNLAKEQCICIEVPKKEYERMQQAIDDLDTGYLSADDFINQQIRALLEKHDAYLKEKEENKKP
jgi:metal-responsive CopG/Arc/MetJ family transcriptional regulator